MGGDGHTHHWLITGAVLFVKSPDSRFEIRVFEKTEYRMGSPQYGRVDILNSPCDTEGYSLGEILAFSPDSRFLAIDELVSWRRHPHTRVIVFELAAGNEFVAHEQTPGIITSLSWNNDGSLSITTFSEEFGERLRKWSPAD